MATILANSLIPANLITFDNVRNFTVSQQIRVSDHPVEFGSDVSDNAQVMPLMVSFEVQITSSPLTIPNPTGIELATTWFELNAGQLIVITASAGIFQNMMLTRTDYTKRITADRWFRVTARQIRVAFGVTVPIPPRLPNPAAAAGLASEAAGGVQPPIPVVPPTDQSAAATLAAAAALVI